MFFRYAACPKVIDFGEMLTLHWVMLDVSSLKSKVCPRLLGANRSTIW